MHRGRPRAARAGRGPRRRPHLDAPGRRGRARGGSVRHGGQEVAEETGLEAVVERLLGVDSRVIPAGERRLPGASELQNVGIFYRVRVTGGRLRPEPNGDTAESVWTPLSEVASLRRSSLVDVGIALAQSLPPTGHVNSVPVGGLVQH